MINFPLTVFEKEFYDWYKKHGSLMPWNLFMIREAEIRKKAADEHNPFAVIDPCYRDYSNAVYDKKLGIIDFKQMALLLDNEYIFIAKQPRFFPAAAFTAQSPILYFVYSGNCNITLVENGREQNVVLSRGDFFMTPANSSKTVYCNEEDSILIQFAFPFRVIEKIILAEQSSPSLRYYSDIEKSYLNQSFLCRTGDDSRIVFYIEQMLTEALGAITENHKIIYMLFELMFRTIQRDYEMTTISGTTLFKRNDAAEYTEYLQKHVSDFSLTDMAAHFNVSKSYLCRNYRKYKGTTLLQDLKSYRVSLACYMLWNTDESVDSISERIGYDDTSYFIEVFRSIMGTTPKKYRSEHAET